jgi:hypothetical protein
MIWGSLALGGAAFAAGALLVGREGVRGAARAAALGLPGGRPAARDTVAGTGLGLAVAGVVLVAVAVAGGVSWSWSGATAGEWVMEGGRSLAWLALPAAAEEVLVRGYPLRVLAAVAGPAVGVCLTSGVFALLHAGNPGLGATGFASIVAAGLFLGALVVRTGSLWWAVGAHLGWNWGLAFLADVPLSGLEVVDAPGLESAVHGPAWLSGGAFGVEGSVLATLGLLAGTGAVLGTERLRRTNPEGPGARSPLRRGEERGLPTAGPAHDTTTPMEADR